MGHYSIFIRSKDRENPSIITENYFEKFDKLK
jgi:hypothetical protein